MKIIAALIPFLLIACSQAPKQSLADSRQNPNAPLAFFNEGNLDDEMRLKYAIAMQRAGIFNFTAEDFSETQIENAIEIRLSYSEERIVFNGVPTLRLQAEFLQDEKTKFKFTIIEESDMSSYDIREKKREKKFRQESLLQRFIEELKRLEAEEKNGA
jgi:hypothetical protein